MVTRQSPSEYLANYHGTYFVDEYMSIRVDMRLYVSGSDLHPDFQRLVNAITPYCVGNPTHHPHLLVIDPARVAALRAERCPTLPATRAVDTDTVWKVASLRRAYMGRGSPMEVFEAAKLAVYAGITTPVAVDSYVTATFGQDCNAFVGNFLGLSPMIGIGMYCERYRPPGQSPQVEAAGTYSYCPAIADPGQIRPGDLLVVYGERDQRGLPYRHIGVVEAFQPDPPRPVTIGRAPPVAMSTSGRLTRVEWGQAGDWEQHYREVTVAFEVGGRTPWPPVQPACHVPITDANLTRIYGNGAKLYFLSSAAIRERFANRQTQVADRVDL